MILFQFHPRFMFKAEHFTFFCLVYYSQEVNKILITSLWCCKTNNVENSAWSITDEIPKFKSELPPSQFFYEGNRPGKQEKGRHKHRMAMSPKSAMCLGSLRVQSSILSQIPPSYFLILWLSYAGPSLLTIGSPLLCLPCFHSRLVFHWEITSQHFPPCLSLC